MPVSAPNTKTQILTEPAAQVLIEPVRFNQVYHRPAVDLNGYQALADSPAGYATGSEIRLSFSKIRVICRYRI